MFLIVAYVDRMHFVGNYLIYHYIVVHVAPFIPLNLCYRDTDYYYDTLINLYGYMICIFLRLKLCWTSSFRSTEINLT